MLSSLSVSALSAALHVCTLITLFPLPLPSSGPPVPPQSTGKGKHRVGTSPSAVAAKCSVQREGREEEEEEEEAAGSSAKRRKREGSHMTGEVFSNEQLCHFFSLHTYCTTSSLASA